MIKYISHTMILVSLVLLTFTSCKEDTITTSIVTLTDMASISGVALYDTTTAIGYLPLYAVDADPMVDALVFYGDSILISEFYPNLPPADNEDILTTYTDTDGAYIFEGLPEDDGKVLMIAPVHRVVNLSGTDNTPDGDDSETVHYDRIHVALDENENDDGNDFIARRYETAIIGSVLLDTDGDGVGDTASGHTISVELRYRNDDGTPVAHAVETAEVIDGLFEFSHLIPWSKYILVLVESPDFDILSGADATLDPDGAGDPDHPNWIPVALTDAERDTDNNFIIE